MVRFLSAVTLSTVLLCAPAVALEVKPFAADSFAAASAAGAPILIDVTASWCPTCRAQKAVLEGLSSDPAFADMVVFEVDFDAQRDAVVSFGARRQSTLIVYRGSQERGRDVGITDPESVRALLAKAY